MRWTMARQREFDTDAVLVAAMDLFWEQGYEATSVEDITAATGLSRSSLYQAFGSKRALLDRAIGRYLEGLHAMTGPLEDGEPGFDGVLGFFDNWERRVTGDEVDASLGCLMVNCTTELAGRDTAILDQVAGYRERLLMGFESALRRAGCRGEVSPGDPRERARALVAGAMGVFVTSRGNEDPADIVEWIRAVRSIGAAWSAT